jgi:hypothetical protein
MRQMGDGGGEILSAEHVVFYSWTLVTQASSRLTEITVEYWQNFINSNKLIADKSLNMEILFKNWQLL